MAEEDVKRRARSGVTGIERNTPFCWLYLVEVYLELPQSAVVPCTCFRESSVGRCLQSVIEDGQDIGPVESEFASRCLGDILWEAMASRLLHYLRPTCCNSRCIESQFEVTVESGTKHSFDCRPNVHCSVCSAYLSTMFPQLAELCLGRWHCFLPLRRYLCLNLLKSHPLHSQGIRVLSGLERFGLLDDLHDAVIRIDRNSCLD